MYRQSDHVQKSVLLRMNAQKERLATYEQIFKVRHLYNQQLLGALRQQLPPEVL